MRKLVSRAIISASVEHCETEVCFLHIQLPDTNVWLPKMHKSLPDVDFESSRSPAKSESWNNPILHCCAVLPTWQYFLNSHVRWMYEIKRAKRLSHALVHLVIARANLFTDHKVSGPPMRAKYKHFRTFVSKQWIILQQIHFLLVKRMVIKAWRYDFIPLLSCFIRKFAISFHAFLCMTFHVIRPWRDSFVSGFPGAVASGSV